MRITQRLFVLLTLGCLLPISAVAATIVEWNFNSAASDSDTATGEIHPSRGAGTLSFLGGATPTFGSVAGGGPSDPATEDNSQLRVTRLPAQGAGNKSVGIEFEITTQGFEQLALNWDQYNSATASRYWRVLYTTDWFNWAEHEVVINTNASTWMRRIVRFDGVANVNNRATVGIRILPEFESTATGGGVEGYVAVKDGSNYSAAGSWWLDSVTITGRALGTTNSRPVLSAFSDLILVEGTVSEPMEFSISDAETAPDLLAVEAYVSDSTVITNLTLEGTGASRAISLRSGKAGESPVTVRVTDEEGDSTESSFTVTVVPRTVDQPLTNFFVLWNFNSPLADNEVASGSMAPAIGAGEFHVIGAGTQSFGSVGQARSSDPAEIDDSMLRITSFPQQGTGNKLAGFEFRTSTVGISNISFSWDQYNSATASRYWRIQYSANGTDFMDHEVFTNLTASTWLRQRTVSFQNVAEAENNPFFAVRLVAEFGAGDVFESVGSSSSYGTTGTLWLDMVGLTGERIATEAPMLSCAAEAEGVRIIWATSASDFVLESKEPGQTEWQAVEIPATDIGGRFEVVFPFEGACRWFRLRKGEL